MTNNYDELLKLAEAAHGNWGRGRDEFNDQCTPGVVLALLSELTALRAAAAEGGPLWRTSRTKDGLRQLAEPFYVQNPHYIATHEEWAWEQVVPAASAPKAELTDEQRMAVRDAIAEALGDAYDCKRVWSAWGYGTMREDDFVQVAEQDDRLDEIVSAAIDAVLAQAAPVAVPADEDFGEALATFLAEHTRLNEDGIDQTAMHIVLKLNDLALRPVPAEDIEQWREDGYIAAAPAAPVAAAVPGGWVKNTGVQPVADDVLVAAIFEDGFRDTGKASSFVWDIADGDPTNVAHYLVLPAAPAPDGAAS